jgi:hypothetical protein
VPHDNQPRERPLGKETISMDAEHHPPGQSVPVQLTRRDALGLAAAVAVSSLAASTATAAAGAGTQDAPRAAELTSVITALLPATSIPGEHNQRVGGTIRTQHS